MTFWLKHFLIKRCFRMGICTLSLSCVTSVWGFAHYRFWASLSLTPKTLKTRLPLERECIFTFTPMAKAHQRVAKTGEMASQTLVQIECFAWGLAQSRFRAALLETLWILCGTWADALSCCTLCTPSVLLAVRVGSLIGRDMHCAFWVLATQLILCYN